MEQFIRDVILYPGHVNKHVLVAPDFWIRLDYLLWSAVAWFLKNPQEDSITVMLPTKQERIHVAVDLGKLLEQQGLPPLMECFWEVLKFYLDGRMCKIRFIQPPGLDTRGGHGFLILWNMALEDPPGPGWTKKLYLLPKE